MGIVKDTLYQIAQPAMLRFFAARPVFPYHHLVSDEKVPHIEFLYRFKTVSAFERDLDFLQKHYKALSPAELLAGKRPENSFLLTFDDGLSEIYHVIYPILKKRRLSAIFFLNPDFVDNGKMLYKHQLSVVLSRLEITGFPDEKMKSIASLFDFNYENRADFISKLKAIPFTKGDLATVAMEITGVSCGEYLNDQKPYVTRGQIREMIADGFYFGGHTMSHRPLNKLDFETQKAEILDSVNWLKREFGIDYSLFAFPFSDKGMSKKLIQALFDYDPNFVIFGNQGIKKDINPQIIQRFGLENPSKKDAAKLIVAENLYKLYNQLTGKYQIKRP